MSSLSPQGFDLRDAGWFLHDIDPSSGRAGFVRTDRAGLSAEPFLDHRWRAAGEVGVGLSKLQAIGAEAPRLNFIWHTSFCASTLLSACLDSPGRCLALKEPRVLVILAYLKRSGQLARFPDLARSMFSLLGRRFDADEQILIKPSNGANTLVVEAAALTQGRMLLLYSDCESFVLSMAKQGAAGFAYVRDLFMSLVPDGHPITLCPAADLLRLTDLQLAAMVWRMQMDHMQAVSARLGDRARSLDCRLFLKDPGGVLPRINDFLELGISPEQLGQVVSGPLFSRDVKHPGQAFNSRSRADDQTRLRAHLGDDLPAAVRMMEAMFPNPPKLANALLAPSLSSSQAKSVAMREADAARERPVNRMARDYEDASSRI